MVDKFLSLPSEKQRVFGLDVERFRTALGERPVVVTAERDRLTVFCGAADGSWRTLQREHDALDRTPRRPENARAFGWSRQIGIAAGRDRLVLAYRRRFTRAGQTSNRRELWVDVVRFDEATQALAGGALPRALPRSALGIDGFGPCLWADQFENRLLILAQAFFANPIRPSPALVLLSAQFPEDDGSELALAKNWNVVRLDSGGWDFGARREQAQLLVVHRRTAPTYAADMRLPIDPFSVQPRRRCPTIRTPRARSLTGCRRETSSSWRRLFQMARSARSTTVCRLASCRRSIVSTRSLSRWIA